MRRVALLVASVFIAAAAMASAVSPPVADELGFGIDISPDAEFDGFYNCSLTIFDLRNDRAVFERSITTVEDDANGMVVTNVDGTKIDFRCSVNATGSQATYEIRGVRDQRQVISTVATIRLP